MALSIDEQKITDVLREHPGKHLSPTVIGQLLGKSCSWASSVCIPMATRGLLNRNDSGHYMLSRNIVAARSAHTFVHGFKLQCKANRISFESEFHPQVAAKASTLRGEWDGENKVWWFDVRDKERAVAMASLLSPPDKSCLNGLCVLDGVSIWEGSPPACASGGFVAAELLSNNGSVAWATASIGMAMPAGAWGEPNGSTITRGTLSASGSLGHPLKLDAISPVPVSERTHRLELKNELDGPVIGFGKRLLSALEAELGGSLFSTNADIVEVTYHDRYLNSPLPASLLLEFISGVKTVYADRWGVTKFNLMLSPFSEEQRPGMPPNKIWHNWPHPDARDRAIEAAFDFSGIEASVIGRSKQDAIHARRLDFMLDNGDTVQVWFDQGCSYWQIPRANHAAGRSWFPFEKSAEAQGEAIASADARVEGQVFPTYIFVGR